MRKLQYIYKIQYYVAIDDDNEDNIETQENAEGTDVKYNIQLAKTTCIL